VLNC